MSILVYYFTSLQKLNSTGKGTAYIPELNIKVEKFSQFIQSSLAPDLVVWGGDISYKGKSWGVEYLWVNLESDLELL